MFDKDYLENLRLKLGKLSFLWTFWDFHSCRSMSVDVSSQMVLRARLVENRKISHLPRSRWRNMWNKNQRVRRDFRRQILRWISKPFSPYKLFILICCFIWCCYPKQFALITIRFAPLLDNYCHRSFRHKLAMFIPHEVLCSYLAMYLCISGARFSFHEVLPSACG